MQSDLLPFSASVIFGVFLAFGTFVFALVRAYSPPFLFFSIFGTISVDILCVRRPSSPLYGYSSENLPLVYRSSVPFLNLQNHQ